MVSAPAGKQQAQEAEHLLAGETAALDLGVGQLAEQIVGRLRPPLLHQRGQIRDQVARRLEAARRIVADADQVERHAVKGVVVGRPECR